MIGFDIRSKWKKEEILNDAQKNADSPEYILIEEDDFDEKEKAQEDEYVYST